MLFTELDPDFPATMSRAVVTGLLREELGYGGLVVSDDLEMGAIIDRYGVEEAVVKGVSAGVDLFLVCHSAERAHAAIEALVRAIEAGKLELSRFNGRLSIRRRRSTRTPLITDERRP